MSKLMHVAYWLVIVILASLLWREHQTEATPAEMQTVAETNPQISADSAAASVVGNRSQASQGEVQRPTSTPPETASVEVTETFAADLNDDATTQMLAQLQRVKTYPARLESEGIDQDWSYQVSSDVERVFTDVTGLDKDHLGGVTCRMTLCEVRVSALTQSPIDTMMRLQKSLIEMPWYTEDYSTIFDATDKDGFYRIYLERDDPS